MEIKGLIAAGGRGTRLRPITHTQNKHLIPIANKPMLFYPIETLANAGIKNIGIVVPPESGAEVRNVVGAGSKWGVKIKYIIQPYPGGLAHVIYVARDFLGKSKFVFHLGDNIFKSGIEKPLKKFLDSNANGLVTILKHEENWRLGVPYFDKKGNLIDYKEKPKNPPHKYCVPGIYFADHHIFECFEGKDKIKPSERGELEIPFTFKYLLDHNYKVLTCKISGWWKDPGQMKDLIDVNRIVLDEFDGRKIEGEVDKKSTIVGDVGIEKGTRIINSKIRGPVVIGKNCVIQDSFIGPYTSIYHESSVINSEIENSMVLKSAVIEGVEGRIGDSLIGNFATVTRNKNGLPREHNFLVGDNCVVDLL
ncbi:glucose-1-phosphate thymidylyltransferase [Patescibacteria group bacterium]|nr:glucose-1-phosphate thymidylyltransferase [Patescibacteria group bacterium]